MKFKLQASEVIASGTGKAPVVSTLEFEEDSLPLVVQHLEIFLRGAGYHLTNLDYDVSST